MKTTCNTLKTFVLFFLFSAGAGINTTHAQLSNLWSDALPPCEDTSVDYQYTAYLHQHYGNTVDLSNPSHHGFTNCFPPPANLGDSTTHTFGSTATATVNVIGVVTFTMNAPAQVTVKVHMLNQSGNSRYFSNEMLQLDISGGNLPAGTLIRQSPVKASKGLTNIQNNGGLYTINSYFDVWTELSMDNGQTWTPCDTSGRMTLANTPFLSLSDNDENTFLSLSPNPCSGKCDISFSANGENTAMLEVFNANGQRMTNLFNKQLLIGAVSHFELDGSGFPEGIYICKLTAGDKSAYRRLIIIR